MVTPPMSATITPPLSQRAQRAVGSHPPIQSAAPANKPTATSNSPTWASSAHRWACGIMSVLDRDTHQLLGLPIIAMCNWCASPALKLGLKILSRAESSHS